MGWKDIACSVLILNLQICYSRYVTLDKSLKAIVRGDRLLPFETYKVDSLSKKVEIRVFFFDNEKWRMKFTIHNFY